MRKEKIIKLFNEFMAQYDEEAKIAIWEEHSQIFKDFWENKILNKEVHELNDSESDDIIRILDVHAKGRKRWVDAVASVMIPQGVWRRLFNEIKEDEKLSTILTKIFHESDIAQKISFIDELYKINESRKNSLTGESANAVNTLLGAFAPKQHLHVVSLNDRKKIIENLGFKGGPDFENDTLGRKVVLSNQAIIEGFKMIGINNVPRTISCFLYESPIRGFWRKFTEDGSPPTEETITKEQDSDDLALFYMESQLEDFLIENWDKTELGRKYDLVEESGEIVSQQYKTDIGKIDILVQDKETKQYVVVELKRNQTSDDTIGQLMRYRGWLEEHKTGGKPTKGIIIAARYDERLYYASRVAKDVEIYLYRVDFKLDGFIKK